MFSSVRVDVVVAMVAYNWEALVWRTNIFGSRKSVRGYIYICMYGLIETVACLLINDWIVNGIYECW